MLSSLSYYIWGGGEEQQQEEEVEDTPTQEDLAPTPEGDWILVGPTQGPLDLGCLSRPRETIEEKEEEDRVDETGSEDGSIEENKEGENNRCPATFGQGLGTPPAKLLKTAQLTRQRTSGKVMSSKSLARTNKAVMVTGSNRKSVSRHNFRLKMAGSNKNLKQC